MENKIFYYNSIPIYVVGFSDFMLFSSYLDKKEGRILSKKIKSDSQINYEDISILEEHILQENCWYKFNTDIIHSVENIKGTRCIIYCR